MDYFIIIIIIIIIIILHLTAVNSPPKRISVPDWKLQ